MKNTKFILLPIILAVVVSGVTIFSFTADNDISKSDEVYSYIPSDITKANPNILVSGGSASMRTTNISNIADRVEYTITGTVLDVGDPIDWYETNLASSGHGAIPVTMSVENVYKGSIDSDTFTIFIDSKISYEDSITLTTTISEETGNNKTYHVHSFEPQFGIGEKVLVHIQRVTDFPADYIIDPVDRATMTPYYNTALAKYGKYQIQDGMAFNEIYPDGRPINDAIQESQQ